METLTYSVYIPNVGDHISINDVDCVVRRHEYNPYQNNQVDSILVESTQSKEIVSLVIVKGTWKVDYGECDTITIDTKTKKNTRTVKTTVKPNIKPDSSEELVVGDEGVFKKAEVETGSKKRTGNITIYPFVVVEVLKPNSRVLVNFGSDFPEDLYEQDLTVKPGRKSTNPPEKQKKKQPTSDIDMTTPGLRILSLRTDDTWCFTKFARLLSQDSIEFDKFGPPVVKPKAKVTTKPAKKTKLVNGHLPLPEKIGGLATTPRSKLPLKSNSTVTKDTLSKRLIPAPNLPKVTHKLPSVPKLPDMEVEEPQEVEEGHEQDPQENPEATD